MNSLHFLYKHILSCTSNKLNLVRKSARAPLANNLFRFATPYKSRIYFWRNWSLFSKVSRFRGPSPGHKSEGNKRGSGTYSAVQENEVSRTSIVSLCSNGGRQFQFERGFELAGPYSEVRPDQLNKYGTKTRWILLNALLVRTADTV